MTGRTGDYYQLGIHSSEGARTGSRQGRRVHDSRTLSRRLGDMRGNGRA